VKQMTHRPPLFNWTLVRTKLSSFGES
jgi:hypothetical protein